MNNDPRLESLKRWNDLARENTENAIVSSMFQAVTSASEPLDSFSTWLLVATAAIASFTIVNAEKIISFISKDGFLACGGFLCLSCLFGLISKIYAVRCKVAISVGEITRKTFFEHLQSYEREEEKIKEGAEFWGISLETGIRMERVLSEFYKPQPKIISWFTARTLRKYEGNPQIGYILLVSMFNKQSLFLLIQAMLFLGFMISGFIYAAAI